MKTLVWVEHDGTSVKDATLAAVTAASKLGEVHLLVAGQGVDGVAQAAAKIAGVGKVGRILAGHLVEDGAEVVVTDVNAAAVEALTATHPGIEVVGDVAALVRADIDVYAPCALGGALDDDTVDVLRASVVCGGANNQLVTEGEGGTADRLVARGITYCPDFLVNAGGVIQVADELHGFSFERARAKTETIFETTTRVLELAAGEGVPPAVAADRLAEERMAAAGG